MPNQIDNLKDVKCERCGRVIGKRSNGAFHQFGMRFIFDKSGRISCPYSECRFENVFRVNRDEGKVKLADYVV